MVVVNILVVNSLVIVKNDIIYKVSPSLYTTT